MFYIENELNDNGDSTMRYQPVNLKHICINKILFEFLEKTKCWFFEMVNESQTRKSNDYDNRIEKFFGKFCKMLDTLPVPKKIWKEMLYFAIRFEDIVRGHYSVWLSRFHKDFECAFFQLYGVTLDGRSRNHGYVSAYGYETLIIFDEGRNQICKIYMLKPLTVKELKKIYLSSGKKQCPGNIIDFGGWKLPKNKWPKKLPYRCPCVYNGKGVQKLPDDFIINCETVRVFCNFKKQWY